MSSYGSWVSVKEKLPKEDTSVLVCFWVRYLDYPMRRVAVFENGLWYASGYSMLDGKVSHWCELPSRDGLEKPDFDEE